MPLLAEVVELVIGVDTHNQTHTAAVVVAATGAMITQVTVPATPAGDRQLLLARPAAGPAGVGDRGTGGYGADLTRLLHGHAEQVVDWTGPSGPLAATAPGPIRWTRPGRP